MAANPPAKTRVTIDEFRDLPESHESPELIHGELIMSLTPIYIHQYMVGELFILLKTQAQQGLAVLPHPMCTLTAEMLCSRMYSGYIKKRDNAFTGMATGTARRIWWSRCFLRLPKSATRG